MFLKEGKIRIDNKLQFLFLFNGIIAVPFLFCFSFYLFDPNRYDFNYKTTVKRAV